MQPTNILHDVGEDAPMGRLYLLLEDLGAFGCNPEAVLAGRSNGRFAELMAFEIARAHVPTRRKLPVVLTAVAAFLSSPRPSRRDTGCRTPRWGRSSWEVPWSGFPPAPGGACAAESRV